MFREIHTRLLIASLCSLLLAGCAFNRANEKIAKQENLLAASGFSILPADTPKRQDILAKLPPYRMIQRAKDGKAVFVYADPKVCNCIYRGDDVAYSQYQQTILELQMAQDEGYDQASLLRESRDDYRFDVTAAALDGWDW